MFRIHEAARPGLLACLILVVTGACSDPEDVPETSSDTAIDEAGMARELETLARSPKYQHREREIERLRSAVEQRPADAAAHAALGREYLVAGVRMHGAAELRRALRLDPDQLDARLLLFDLALADADARAARTLLDAAPSRRESAAFRVALARLAILEGEPGARAEELLRAALAVKPDHPAANYQLGVLLVDRGDAAGALPFLEKACDRQRDDLGAWFNRARALRMLGRTAEADAVAAVHRRLARLDDLGYRSEYDTPAAAAALAEMLAEGGDVPGALAELEDAERRLPAEPLLVARRALWLARSEQHAAAVAEYEAGLRRMPGNLMLENQFAWYLATAPEGTRDPVRAAALARAAVDATRARDPNTLDTLAQALAAGGDFAAAEGVMEQAVRLAPDDPTLQKRHAEFRRKAGGGP